MKVVLLTRLAPGSAIDAVQLVNPLHDPSTATTLRRRGAELVLTDGPFAESAEPVASLEEVDVDRFDDAVDLAARRPGAGIGAVEVRSVQEDPDDDDDDDDDDAPAVAPAEGRRYLFLHALPTDRSTVVAAPTGSLPDWLAAPLTRRAVLAGNRLRPSAPSTAATVRVRNGETVVEPGLQGGRGQEIAGYDLITARDLDEAIEVARPHPTLAMGAIEIRPLVMA